ncbi:MAG: hypothetical protein CO094_09230 [Anaerolineae bacterium CG_4_9_14_3_um_filter_57_17]|nr:hypothetical protein [bacterium]NCT20528.1 hypothetical protein [bacterium]PJB65720.1 MAG: hypothetical protein CO094_09230 [Anaerolineae bacterium CG_4_9_14_3_um_filter_57_17]
MDRYHQRLKALFADIERLSEMPDIDMATMRRETQSLRARVIELEMRFLESQKSAALPDPIEPVEEVPARPRPPILYEKEQVGYTYTGDKLEPLQISTLTGLDVQHALHIPLTETGETVGVMYIEPPADRKWLTDDSDLAESVVQQVSLQIQSLRLLAEAERARAEAQAATRRFSHVSWQNYLDAIHQNEQVGYSYDQNAVAPFNESLPAEADFEQTVQVMDDQVGQLYLKTSPVHPLNADDKALVAAVARQLGQQVENLRLLADASRARADAEEATRRLTHESWQDYVGRNEDATLGFVYDLNRVAPLEGTPTDISLSQPLTVRGETIGELALAGLVENPSADALEMLSAIAAQTSVHLETLRLNEELQKRAAELLELDRLKSSFLANMSHELRTPLNSILGFSDVILEGIDGELTENMQSDLRLIQKNGQHLLHLVNDVLDMAKIESGRMNLHLEKFKIKSVFDEVNSITSSLANEKNLALIVEPDSDAEVEIFADVIRMRQVIINLVNNAIKFTQEGQVALRVDKLGEDKVLIRVKDTGIGIPADHLEKIFQEFSQVDSTTTRKAGGTGLGLPISRKLVEMHGGRMWAESANVPGEGSTFYVEIPVEAQIRDIEKTVK